MFVEGVRTCFKYPGKFKNTSARYFTRHTHCIIPGVTAQISPMELIKNKLSSLNVKFYFKSDEIDVIYQPSSFYDLLKHKISTAKHRIFIASLYIGENEYELVQYLSEALKKNNALKVYFMVDGLRGTREAPKTCSASLLSRLVKDHSGQVDIRLYKTPEYTGWKQSLIPKRFNEGLGIQHMKIYGFDDEVILSGANLSVNYFTNRQDRYYIFRSKSFADYYFKLHQLISSISYKVVFSNNTQKYTMFWPKSNLTVESDRNKRVFFKSCSEKLKKVLRDTNQDNDRSRSSSFYPTIVYPISQFTPLFVNEKDLSTEKPSILSLLSCLPQSNFIWTFTAGYFNMLPEIKHMLLFSNTARGEVITASPYANGFFQSKGVSKYLPDAYLYLSKQFLYDVYKYQKQDIISLKEWKKGIVTDANGWSYHAKGIWISESGDDQRPFLTVIGSSNYTRRAYSLDLESNAIIFTKDDKLRDAMKLEVDNILSNTREVKLQDFSNTSRKISLGVKLATKILGDKL